VELGAAEWVKFYIRKKLYPICPISFREEMGYPLFAFLSTKEEKFITYCNLNEIFCQIFPLTLFR
jgi:hypothetical protein